MMKIRDIVEVNLISDGLENNNHSGASFSGCLRLTSAVFQNGWYPKYSKYVNNVQLIT